MKRLTCILAAFLLIVCQSAYADTHFGIEGVFTGELAGKTVTLDLYEQNGKTEAVSSLIQDYAALLEGEDGKAVTYIRLLTAAARPEVIRGLETAAESILNSWLAVQRTETRYGSFSGILFTDAHSVSVSEFSAADLARYAAAALRDRTAVLSSDEKTAEAVRTVLEKLAESLLMDEQIAGLTLKVQRYDEGTWTTVLLMNGSGVTGTLSYETTEDGQKHILFSQAENGRYYYRDFRYSIAEGVFSLSCELRASAGTFYASASALPPLYREEIMITDRENGNSGFTVSLDSEKLNAPLTVTGSVIRGSGEDFIADINVSIMNHDTALNIRADYENLYGAVSFSDKKLLNTGNEEEREELRGSFMTGLFMAATEILPALPVEYQLIIFSLLYQ